MGYDETTNLKLKKPTVGTSKTDWPGYINGNFDTLDAEVANRHKKTEDILPDQDNTRSLGSAIRRFLNGFFSAATFNQITLGGVARTAWPSPGSGSQSMDDVYNNGTTIAVDNTDVTYQLGSGKKFKLVNADGTITYLEAEGAKGITIPDVRQNILTNSQFAVWSNATQETVGANIMPNGTFDTDPSGWSVTNGTIASVSGGQSNNCLQITLSSGSLQYADSSAITTVAGKLYRMTLYIKSGTGGTAYITQVFNSGKSTVLGQITGSTTSSWVQASVVFRASDSISYVRLIKYNATAGTMLFDEVAVNEVTPGCVAAGNTAMDGWYKYTNTLVYRQYNDTTYTRAGAFYSLKVVGSSTDGSVWWPGPSGVNSDAAWAAQFKGRTVTLGCWVWCASTSKAKISIFDTQETSSSYHSGSGAWEWLEVTRTVSTSTTGFYIMLYSGTSTTAYFSQPQLIFGSSIGPGNYTPRIGEIIWLDTPIASSTLNNVSGLSTAALTAVNLEGDTLGAIGKGAKAVYLYLAASDSASAGGDAQARVVAPSTGAALLSCSPAGLANGLVARAGGWIPLTTAGTYYYALTATGSGTLTISQARIVAVQF